MALLINKTIGTNRGTTDSAYVRIERFEIDSYTGTMRVFPTLYMNSDTAASASTSEFNEYNPAPMKEQYGCSNVNVAETYKFYLTSSIEATRMVEVTQEVSSSHEIEIPEGTGSRTEITWTTEISQSMVEETYMKPMVDVSAITGSTVYDFAYPLLKYELKKAFGSDSILDI